MKQILALAALCLFIGSMLLVGPSFGFTSVASDRGVSVSTGAEDESLIALVDEQTSDLPNNDFETVGSLENNVGDSLETEYVISASEPVTISFDGQTGETVSGSFTLSEPEPIEVECGPPGNRDSDIVTLTVEIPEATSGGVTITNAEMELELYCDDTPPSDTEFDASDVDESAEQRFTASVDELGSNDGFSIDLTSAQESGKIDYSQLSDDDVELVEGRGEVSFDPDEMIIRFDGQGSQTGNVIIDISGFSIESGGSEIAYYEDDIGRTASGEFEIDVPSDDE